MRKVLGVDPGETTGLSLIEDGEVCFEGRAKSLYSLWMLLNQIIPDVLVVEAVLGHSPSHVVMFPFKAMGICEAYAEKMDITLALSNPSILQGKKKPKGVGPHVWSARTHALAYLEKYG